MNSRFKFSVLLFLLPLLVAGKADKFRAIFTTDPSTSITIAWNQISGEAPAVYYDITDFGQASQSYGSSVQPHKIVSAKGMNNHFVQLTGLLPATKYYFVVKDSDATSRRLYFTTLPDHIYERLSIIAGGDSRNNRVARQSANLMVSKLKPHVVLFGGDMTGGDNSKQWPQWMDDWQLTTTTDGRMTPIIPARGNHEYSNQTLVDLFDVPNEDVYYAVNLGGNLIRSYTLNSLISAGGNQAKWLEADLQKSEDAIWKFAQYHYPIRPHTAKKRNRENQWNSWAGLFYEYGVNLVVECDAHTVKTTWPVRPSNDPGNEEGFIRDDENGTIYVGEGCWGAPLRPNNNDRNWTRASGSFNQFKWLYVDAHSIEIRSVKTDNATVVAELNEDNRFYSPEGIDIWKPPTGDVITILNDKPVALLLPEMPQTDISEAVAIVPPPKPEPKNEITSFLTEMKENIVHLKLELINVSKPMNLELQRSSNGEYFKTIDSLIVKDMSPEPKSVELKDERAAYMNQDEVFYRIRKVADGVEVFTPVKSIVLASWENYELALIHPVHNVYRLEYEVMQPIDVAIKIYNDNGEEVKQELYEKQEPGKHTKIINVAQFEPGIYLCEIQVGEKKIVKRMVL